MWPVMLPDFDPMALPLLWPEKASRYVVNGLFPKVEFSTSDRKVPLLKKNTSIVSDDVNDMLNVTLEPEMHTGFDI